MNLTDIIDNACKDAKKNEDYFDFEGDAQPILNRLDEIVKDAEKDCEKI